MGVLEKVRSLFTNGSFAEAAELVMRRPRLLEVVLGRMPNLSRSNGPNFEPKERT